MTAMARLWAQLRAEWLEIDDDKKRAVYSLFISCFVTCFAGGFAFGWYDSPSYSSESAAEKFAAANFQWTVKGDNVLLRVRAGHWIYQYTTATPTVDIIPLSPATVAQLPLARRRNYDEEAKLLAIAGLVAAPGGAVTTASSAAATMSRIPEKLKVVVAVVAVCAGYAGGWLGYHLAYHDNEDYDDPEFHRALTNPKMWSGWAAQLQAYRQREREHEVELESYKKMQRERFTQTTNVEIEDFNAMQARRFREGLLEAEVSRHSGEIAKLRAVWNPHRVAVW